MMDTARPLILLHGWGLHGGIWQSLATRLTGLLPGRPVWTPDLPGYAGQPPAASLEATARQLLASWPAQFDLVGWSLGGLVALTVARIAPERIGRLVLVGTSPCFVTRPDWACGMDESVFSGFAHDLEGNWEATLKRFLALQVRQDQHAKAALASLRTQLFARGQPEPVVLRTGLALLLHSDLRNSLADIVNPALVIHGAYDQLVPVCAAEALASGLQDGRLTVMPGASHAPFLSHDAAFAGLLADFVGPQAGTS